LGIWVVDGGERRTVAETIPLGAALRVERPDVVVDDPGGLLVDFLVEGLPAEEGDVFLGVEGPVEADADAGLDFAGGGFDDVVGQAVEGAELVVFAVSACHSAHGLAGKIGERDGLQAPGVVVRAALVEWELGELGDFVCHCEEWEREREERVVSLEHQRCTWRLDARLVCDSHRTRRRKRCNRRGDGLRRELDRSRNIASIPSASNEATGLEQCSCP